MLDVVNYVVQSLAEELDEEPEDLPADVCDIQPSCVFKCFGL